MRARDSLVKAPSAAKTVATWSDETQGGPMLGPMQMINGLCTIPPDPCPGLADASGESEGEALPAV